MKPLVAFLLCGVLLGQEPGQIAPTPLTDQRIIDLAHGGVSPDELGRVIGTAPQISFDLSPAAENQMLQSGVSEGTIRAMAARESGLGQSPNLAPTASPLAPIATTTPHQSHRVRKWIIIGLVGVAAGGAAYAGYRLSNPHHCGPVSFYPAPNPTCN